MSYLEHNLKTVPTGIRKILYLNYPLIVLLSAPILGLPLGATLVAFHHLAIWQVILVALIGAAGSFAGVGFKTVCLRSGAG